MAKQKASALTEDEQITVPVNEPTPTIEAPPVEAQAKKVKSDPVTEELKADEYTLNILRTFPSYASMYIDRQGGIYTPDTPEKLRGNAVLYKNPYHKP